jgi:hypothetical protein
MLQLQAWRRRETFRFYVANLAHPKSVSEKIKHRIGLPLCRAIRLKLFLESRYKMKHFNKMASSQKFTFGTGKQSHRDQSSNI